MLESDQPYNKAADYVESPRKQGEFVDPDVAAQMALPTYNEVMEQTADVADDDDVSPAAPVEGTADGPKPKGLKKLWSEVRNILG